MSDIVSGIFTKKLTNSSWTILSSYGFTNISIMLTSGTATVNGLTQAAGEDSAAIDMVANVPFNIMGKYGAPLSGIVITASSGVVQIACSK